MLSILLLQYIPGREDSSAFHEIHDSIDAKEFSCLGDEN